MSADGKYGGYGDLASFTYDELEEYVTGIGGERYRAGQIYGWIHKRLAAGYGEMANVPKSLREKLAEKYPVCPMGIAKKLVSKKDGTAKYLMRAMDGNIIESVAMHHPYGMSVCISSQAGCRMGCVFCASGIAGLKRSLTASEMLSQIYLIQKDMGKRVGNVVVMGIGEPFDNYGELVKFLHMATDANGLNISQRNITVSTCGITDGIYDFANEGMAVTLAVSLHAPDDALRRSLMPVANRYSLSDLKKACLYYADKAKRRITFEYAMISGVNDTPECAERLAEYVDGLPCHINLIPLNDVKERNGKASSAGNIRYFQKYLEKKQKNVTIRKGMGKDIEAACGQLRREYLADLD